MKSLFLDNTSYGTTEINQALGALENGAVSGLAAQTAYTPASMNALVKALAGKGVVDLGAGALKVVKSGAVYRVNPGTAVFEDGCLALLSGEERIAPRAGGISYVYLQQGLDHPICSQWSGEAGTIPLARIEADGSVTDQRSYSDSKRVPNGCNFYCQAELPWKYIYDNKTNDVLGEVELPCRDFKQVMIQQSDTHSRSFLAYFDFENNTAHEITTGLVPYYENMRFRINYLTLTLKKVGSKIQVVLIGPNYDGWGSYKFIVTVC